MKQQQVPHRKGDMRKGHLQDGALPKQNGAVGAKAPRSQGGRWQLLIPGRGVARSVPELGHALPSWLDTHRALWCQRRAESSARAAWDGDKDCCGFPLASASRLGMGRDRLSSPRFTLQTPPVTLCRDRTAAGCCQRAAAACVQAGLWPQELTQPSPLTLLRQLPVPFSCLSCDRMLTMQVPGP